MNRQGTICFATLAVLLAAGLPRVEPTRAISFSARTTTGVIYAGLQDGYAYKSTDGGIDWQEADNGLPSDSNITALAVTPDGSTAFAGLGGDGSGVYVSTDGGMNWRDDNDEDLDIDTEDSQISGLALNPEQSQSIYAVTINGTFYAGTDGGDHWTGLVLPTNSIITSLAVNRHDPAVLLIGTQGGGILRSSDGGVDWTNTDLSDSINVQAIAFSPKTIDVAYAATDSGIYETIDGGASWQSDRRGIPAGMSFQSIAIDPSDPARIIAGGSFGDLYRSQDGGTSWSYQGQAGNDQANAILFDLSHPGVVFVGTEDGDTLYRSSDSGGHWYGYPTDFASGEGILSLAASTSPTFSTLPTDPVAAPSGNPPGVRYFPQTHHTVSGPFLTYYNANNGLKIFGLPLTEAFSDEGQTVQYFERSRLIYTHGRISLTPLGSQLTVGRGFQPVGCCPPSNQLWFSRTNHTISGKFLTFWLSHKGAQLFGYPISQPLYEQNGDGTGRTYLVQYFQNARLEYHPELAGTGNVVTLGLLGKEALQKRGWL